jgi:hypothetical protein
MKDESLAVAIQLYRALIVSSADSDSTLALTIIQLLLEQ